MKLPICTEYHNIKFFKFWQIYLIKIVTVIIYTLLPSNNKVIYAFAKASDNLDCTNCVKEFCTATWEENFLSRR
jgi:hypothetical protein